MDGFIVITYGMRIDPELLTESMVERIENNEIDVDELHKMGAEDSHFEAITWKQGE